MSTQNITTSLFTLSICAILGARCAPITSPTTAHITTATTTTSTIFTTTTSASTSLPTNLTRDEVLNSNGFQNGIRVTSGTPQNLPIEEMTSSSIVFGDLDGDALPEAAVPVLWCATSCGSEVYVFKKDADGIKSYLLTETYKNHPSKDKVKKITLNNRLLTIVRTRGSGTKDITNTYHITFSEDGMIATDGKTGEPVNTTRYTNPDFGFSFAYPEYYQGMSDCQLRTSTVPDVDWLGTIGDGIELSVQKAPPAKNINELIAENLKDVTVESQKNTKIDGIPGVIVEYLAGGIHRYGKNVFWKKDGHLFTLAVVAQGTHCEQGMPQVLHVADSLLKSFVWQK